MADFVAATLGVLQWILPIALVVAATIPMIIQQNRSHKAWLDRLEAERRNERHVDKPPT